MLRCEVSYIKLKGANCETMNELYQSVEEFFFILVEYLVLLIELVGTCVLIYAVVASIIGIFRKQDHIRLKLAEGIALALEFKVGGELLRTVVVREFEELLILGSIILLRAALTFLIQWEIKIEKRGEELRMLESEKDNAESE